MKVVEFVEIDIPVCSRTHGVSPCTAGGASKCYNTRTTCQDAANYAETSVTLRFGHQDADDKSNIDNIPSLEKISYRPQTVSLAEDLGVRASLSVTINDHRDADIGDARDPYWQTRGIDAYATGTFWGKFRARHAYMVGSIARYVQGEEGQIRSAMTARSFVVEKITGPSLDGKVTITAKDMLKLADDDKAQCPVISTGRLSSDITTSATTFTIFPSGVGSSEYPDHGYVTIGGNEVCYFTRSGDSFTISRAQFNTTAATHKQGDIVQLCKRFFDDAGNGMDPADIVYDLLVNYSSVPSSWVTIGDWREKTEQFLAGRRYYALIGEPTSVRGLLNELVYQAGIILWTDDVKMQIRMDMVRNFPVRDIMIDEDSTVENTFDVTDQPTKRLSQVWVYYGQRNPLEKVDESTNYSAAVAVVDEEMEEAHGVPSIKKIHSRWIPRNNRPSASDVAYYLLSRFRSAPRAFAFSTWRDNPLLALAGRYNITAWPLQDADGNQVSAQVQITKLLPTGAVLDAEAQEIAWHVYPDQPDQGLLVVIDNDICDVNFRSEYDKSYSPPESGDTVTCLVEAGIIVGSTSVWTPAFTVGSWPSGVTLKIILRGYVVGHGGNGGSGGCACRSNGQAGSAGGPAFYTRTPVLVTNEGVIGGGGGGGGGGAGIDGSYAGPGGGGGGGAGYLAGAGGDGELGGGCWWTAYNGAAGTLTTGGAGGDAWRTDAGSGGNGGALGQAGSAGGEDTYRRCGTAPGAGGAAGTAVDGNSYITWATLGDIRGARVN